MSLPARPEFIFSFAHPVATPPAGPAWRTLVLLAILVLLAHVLVLRQPPVRFGQAQDAASRSAAAFSTRSVALPAAAETSALLGRVENPITASAESAAKPVATPAAVPVAKAARSTAAQTISKKNKEFPQEPPTFSAINIIAKPVLESEAGNAFTTPEEMDGAALPATPSALSTFLTPSPPVVASTQTADLPESPESEQAKGGPNPPATPAASVPPASPLAPSVTPVTTMALPASAGLEYRMTGSAKGLTYHAKGELAWQNNGDSYDARMTVGALFIGSRTMTSRGQVTAEGLAPSRFSDKYKSEVAAHFDADKGQISFSANTPAVPFVKGAQDRVSVFMQLGGMLAGSPVGFPVGSTISTYTVGPRDADGWIFRVENEEQLALPFGDLATVKLSRQPRREFDQKVEIWYAPSLGYLPVRSKITQANGDFVDQQLNALTRP